jgi:small subunit ribosomal protein S17
VKQLTGVIISDKMQLSAVVLVETSFKHPLYKKTVRRSKKFLVENTVKAKTGDTVTIEETRPLSARKRFTITKVMNK